MVAAWCALSAYQGFGGLPGTQARAMVRTTISWLPTALTHVPRQFGTFVMVSILVAAMSGPGAVILSLARISWHSRLEMTVFRIAAGLSGWVVLVLVVGSTVGLSRVDVLLPTLVYVSPAVVLGIRSLRARRWRSIPLPSNIGPGFVFDAVVLVVLAFLLYLVLLACLAPETYFDARWYHLGSAKHFVEVGRFYNIVQATHDPAMGLNPYQEISFTGLFALFGQHGARLLSFMDEVLVVAGICAFARVHFRSLRIGLLASVAFLSIPVAAWSGTSGYNDLPVALYTLLSAHAVFSSVAERRHWGWMYLAVAAGAFSFGIKIFGLFTLALAGAVAVSFLVVQAHRDHVIRPRPILITGAIVAATCVPWWWRVDAMTGDPVFPLFTSVFKTPYWNHYAAAARDYENRHVSLVGMPFGLVKTLWTTVTEPIQFHTLTGPFFLAGIPIAGLVVLFGLLSGQGRSYRVVVGLFAYVLAWSAGWYISAVSDSRYLLGVAPLACLMICGALLCASRSAQGMGLVIPVAAGCLGLVALSTVPPLDALQRSAPSPYVLGETAFSWDYLFKGEPEQDVQLQYMPMVEFANSHLPAKTSKLFDYGASLNSEYLYLDAEYFNGSGYGSPATMRQWSLSSSDVLTELKENGITDIVAATGSLPSLQTLPLWSHLRLIHESADGLVLLEVEGIHHGS